MVALLRTDLDSPLKLRNPLLTRLARSARASGLVLGANLEVGVVMVFFQFGVDIEFLPRYAREGAYTYLFISDQRVA